MNTINRIPIGIADSELRIEHVCLEDYTDEKYEAKKLLKDQYGRPVAICHTKGAPTRYRVIHGTNMLFFPTYKDVLDYCTEHKCKPINGGKDYE